LSIFFLDYYPSIRAWKWEIDYKKLQIDEKKQIGEGSFGTVYFGYFHGTPVAIKILKMKAKNSEEMKKKIHQLEDEVGLMRYDDVSNSDTRVVS
jgi:predicted Ser/Thr protein kinase